MAELFAQVRRDERGERRGLIVRRVVMTVFALITLLALFDRFGQKASSSLATTPRARMELVAPETVRGGLFFQSRIEIHALDRIAHPRLVLDEGWVEGMQVNSIEPAAGDEESRDGKVVLSYATLEPGDVLKVWLQFEVDPTNNAVLQDAAEALRDPRIFFSELARLLVEQLKFRVVEIEKFPIHAHSQSIDDNLSGFDDVGDELDRNMNRMAHQFGTNQKANLELDEIDRLVAFDA